MFRLFLFYLFHKFIIRHSKYGTRINCVCKYWINQYQRKKIEMYRKTTSEENTLLETFWILYKFTLPFEFFVTFYRLYIFRDMDICTFSLRSLGVWKHYFKIAKHPKIWLKSILTSGINKNVVSFLTKHYLFLQMTH